MTRWQNIQQKWLHWQDKLNFCTFNNTGSGTYKKCYSWCYCSCCWWQHLHQNITKYVSLLVRPIYLECWMCTESCLWKLFDGAKSLHRYLHKARAQEHKATLAAAAILLLQLLNYYYWIMCINQQIPCFYIPAVLSVPALMWHYSRQVMLCRSSALSAASLSVATCPDISSDIVRAPSWGQAEHHRPTSHRSPPTCCTHRFINRLICYVHSNLLTADQHKPFGTVFIPGGGGQATRAGGIHDAGVSLLHVLQPRPPTLNDTSFMNHFSSQQQIT